MLSETQISATPARSAAEPNPLKLRRRAQPPFVAGWIVFCVFCNCAGWILSALHALSAAGYAVVFLLGLAGLIAWRKKTGAPSFSVPRWTKLRTRFRRAFPLAFLVLATLETLGGVLYAPTNYDALAYRTPRVLHWLAQGRWHWIHTDFARLNVRAPGFEWLSAPLLALTNTDRVLFLINAFSFLLLPGLIFSLFRRLGVRPRVAWHWMWIVPTGYCFLLQGGSIANDMFGAVYALAAVDFALRARESKNPRDLSLSVLSAVLLAGSKASNLPLLLPWAIALLPSLKLLLRRPLALAGVGAAALLASVAPTAVLNWEHCGDWSGLVLESGGQQKLPLFRVSVNSGLLLLQNFAPPVFPFENWWQRTTQRLMPAAFSVRLRENFEPAASRLAIGEMQIEEQAALGFGVCALLAVSVAAVLLCRKARPRAPNVSRWQWLILLSPFFSLAVLISQSGLSGIGRIIAPYYMMLIPVLLIPAAHERLVRRSWWRWSAGVVFLLAGMLVVISPARPLFPVTAVLKKLPAEPANPLTSRISRVYASYQKRWDSFAPVRAKLPAEAAVLGLVSFDDPETSLWRPFGSRRIEHVLPGDTVEALRRRGIEYVLVNSTVLAEFFKEPVAAWAARMNAEIIWKMPLRLKTSLPAADWYLVRLRPVVSKLATAAPSR